MIFVRCLLTFLTFIYLTFQQQSGEKVVADNMLNMINVPICLGKYFSNCYLIANLYIQSYSSLESISVGGQ